MKYKFLVLLIILCLALCACNSAGEEVPTAGETNAPTENVTDGAAATDSAGTTTDSAEDPAPTDKGLFVTDPEPVLTLPHSFGSVVLPEEEFGDDIEGVSSSRPLDETVPEDSDPNPTEAPNTNYNPPVTLPEDVFDFD